jgi:hypothetical protein
VTELQALLAGRTARDEYSLPGIPALECKDGFSVSMQTGKFLYCEPRDNAGPWTHVELGFPSGYEEELMEYAEDKDRPTGTVYGWVPLELVARVVTAHGGLK